MGADRPPRRPAEPPAAPPVAPGPDVRRACCGASPMVTTSLQSVHATPQVSLPLVLRPGGVRVSTSTPMEERPVADGTTLSALVRAAARQRPEAPAVVAGDRRLS